MNYFVWGVKMYTICLCMMGLMAMLTMAISGTNGTNDDDDDDDDDDGRLCPYVYLCVYLVCYQQYVRNRFIYIVYLNVYLS